MNRRAKIVCTLGPATSSEEGITALLEAGMNVARMNFSHGDHADHAAMAGKPAGGQVGRDPKGEDGMWLASMAYAIRFLLDRGADDVTAVTLLSAPEGIAHLQESLAGVTPPITLVTGAIDERLNDVGYIVPGLGDAGDRLYGLAQ